MCGAAGQPSGDVAVKILKDDDWCQPSLASIEDFKREVKIVSSFDHDNILRLIAIVPVGEISSIAYYYSALEHGAWVYICQLQR